MRVPRLRVSDASYKWWALSCTCLGTALATTNSGTLVIALPDLERALGVSLLTLVWVILGFMIASTVLVLPFGSWADVHGRARAFTLGFAIFTAAALGAGFASGGTGLIIWRIVQGVGGAFIFANAPALVADAFPPRQLGVAIGWNVMVASIGLVIGPVLGGALVQISWQWVFWFNVPVGLLGTLWSWLVLRELAHPDAGRPLDVAGTVTFVIALTGLTLGISRGGVVSWSDPLTIASLVAAAVTTPMFVLAELRTRTPMIELTLFRDRSFSALTAASFLGGLSRFALTFLFVLYFQGAQGDDPILAGAKLAPLAVGMLVASPIAGRHADARRGRVLAVAGMLVSAAGMALMTLMTVDTAYWVVAILLAIVGVGIGMFQSPNATAMMQSVPEHRRGVAAGVRMVLQNAGAVLSLAVVLAVVTSAVPRDVLLSIFSGLTSSLSPQALDPFIHNLHVALWILVASALCGAAASFMRPSDRVAVGSLAQERRSEGKASV